MAVARKLTDLDTVELVAAVDDAPAGARGGVVEMRPDGFAMVEVLEPRLDAAARIVFVPASELRLVRAGKQTP